MRFGCAENIAVDLCVKSIACLVEHRWRGSSSQVRRETPTLGTPGPARNSAAKEAKIACLQLGRLNLPAVGQDVWVISLAA